MTTEQFERAHVLITKINQHKNNIEDLEDFLKENSISRQFNLVNDKMLIGYIPRLLSKKILQMIIEHHTSEIERLEAELEKI